MNRFLVCFTVCLSGLTPVLIGAAETPVPLIVNAGFDGPAATAGWSGVTDALGAGFGGGRSLRITNASKDATVTARRGIPAARIAGWALDSDGEKHP